MRFDDLATEQCRDTMTRARAHARRRDSWDMVMFWIPTRTLVAWRFTRKHLIGSAVSTLTIGIALTGSLLLFEIANALWLSPLGVPHPEQLVTLTDNLSSEAFGMLKDRAETLIPLAAFRATSVRMAVAAEQIAVPAYFVTEDFFRVIGVKPEIGSVDLSDLGVLLSHATWHRRFGMSRLVVGDYLVVNDVPLRIRGVLPATFRGTTLERQPDLYISSNVAARLGAIPGNAVNSLRWLTVLGRLRTASALTQTAIDLNSLQPTEPHGRLILVPASDTALPLRSRPAIFGSLGMLLLMLLLALLSACLNVAHWLLLCLESRTREIGVQLALGAPRGAVIGQFVLEAFYLLVPATLVAIFMCLWSDGVVQSLEAARLLPIAIEVTPSWTGVVAAAIVWLALLIFGGFIPWVAIRRRPVSELLAHNRITRSTERGRPVFGSMLVASQTAVTVALTVITVLLSRTVTNQESIDIGLDVDRVALVQPHLLQGRISDVKARQIGLNLIERLSTLVGVDSVGASAQAPLQEGVFARDIVRPGPGDRLTVAFNEVDSGYFASVGIRMLAGRNVEAIADERYTVINESMAQALWGERSPLGETVELWPASSGRLEVIGVVSNSRYENLVEQPRPIMYVPLRLASWKAAVITVRAGTRIDTILSSVREASQKIVSSNGQVEVVSLNAAVDALLAQPRARALFAGGVATITCVFAITGLYNLLSFLAFSRRREIAIRMALGSTRARASIIILSHALKIGLSGLIAGATVVALSSSLASRFLYGIEPFDVRTVSEVAIVTLLVILFASGIPAWAATQVDQMMLLKSD
jgi:predicted permease